MKIPLRHQCQPDETIFSWVARLHRVSATLSTRQTFDALFNVSKVRMHPYLPAHLGVMATQTGVPRMELLYQHTLYPLFRWFGLDPNRRLKTAMLSNRGERVCARAKLPQAKIAFFDGQKFCPHCVFEDLERLGFGYFKTYHQIPGIEACYFHGCLLEGIEGGDFGYDRQIPLPPHANRVYAASDLQVALAQFAYKVLRLALKQRRSCDYQPRYWDALTQRNLLTVAHHLRFKTIQTHLQTFYQDYEFGQLLGLPETFKSFEFCGPLLRHKTHFPCHPTKHLVLARWLFDDKPQRYLRRREKRTKLLPPLPTAKEDTYSTEVLAMIKDGSSMRYIQQQTGRSQSFVRRIAELNGVPHATNSQSFPISLKRKVIIKALHGQHRSDIAKVLNVSTGYVEQVISATPDLANWRKYLRHQTLVKEAIKELKLAREEHPKWRRKEIKQYCEKAFFRLYLHDKALLESLLPPRTRPAPPTKCWKVEDLRLLYAIQRLANPSALSIGQIDHLVHGRGFLRKHLNKLPRTRRLLVKLHKLDK